MRIRLRQSNFSFHILIAFIRMITETEKSEAYIYI